MLTNTLAAKIFDLAQPCEMGHQKIKCFIKMHTLRPVAGVFLPRFEKFFGPGVRSNISLHSVHHTEDINNTPKETRG